LSVVDGEERGIHTWPDSETKRCRGAITGNASSTPRLAPQM